MSSSKDICGPCGLENVEVVDAVEVRRYRPESLLVLRLDNKALSFFEIQNHVLVQIHGLHQLTCCNTVLIVDDIELTILHRLPASGLFIVALGHDTECLPGTSVWQVK